MSRPLPPGVAQLPGAEEIYERYHAALDARDAQPAGQRTEAVIAEVRDAGEELAAFRSFWRQVGVMAGTRPLSTAAATAAAHVELADAVADDTAPTDPQEG